MKRRFAPLAVLAATAIFLAGCTMSSETPAPEETAAGGDTNTTEEMASDLQIGLVAVNANSPSIARINDAFVSAAEAAGWTVEVFDGQGDQNATNNAANDFISRGFDAVVNNSSPNQQMTGVIENAEAAGVPFVSIYGGYVPGLDAEIGTNEFVHSSLITQEMVNALGGEGRVVKMNWTVLQALRDRDEAFNAVVGQAPGIEVARSVDIKVPGQIDDAYAQMTNILASDPDIDAVWIGWDELAPPVVRAIEEAGLQDEIVVYGFDGNPFAWDLIRENSPYVMETAGPFEPMGERAVQAINTLVGGGTLSPNVIYMKPCLITRETVPAQGEMPDWENCAFFPGEIE